MKASRIIIISAGVFSLALAGLYSWSEGISGEALRSEQEDTMGSAPISASPFPPRWQQKERVRIMTTARLSPTNSAPSDSSASSPSTAAVEAAQEEVIAGLEDALATARQESEPGRRIEALKFIGEHGIQSNLEDLQQIQIQDPVPDVRRAAEEAARILMARFVGQPWPGISTEKDPLGYIRDAPSSNSR